MIREFGTGDLIFLIYSCRWTIGLSLIAFAGGALLGVVVALARISKYPVCRLTSTSFVRVIQGTPLLMQLFIAFFLPNVFGIQISALTAAGLGLSVNASAFLGEIWRGAIQSVPKGQWEAASALGLGYIAQLRLVIIPQAIRIALPPTAGFLVQLIKGTSLAAIIGFTELTRAGQLVVSTTYQPFLVFSIVAVFYFALCWPLTVVSGRMESGVKGGGRR